MKTLLFGTSGIPLSTQDRNTINGIKRVAELGLDNMEIEFVRSINITAQKAPLVKETAKKSKVHLTCHGQYWVNCNGVNENAVELTRQRMVAGSLAANACGAWSICYHMAYYMQDDPAKVTAKIIPVVKSVVKELQDNGANIWLRPETGGKTTQWGALHELIELSKNCEQVLPCIDWAHHHSRTFGKFNTPQDYEHILVTIEKELGREALSNMHCHIEGIEYGTIGEKKHLNLKESSLNWKPIVQAWKDFKIKGVITCESPNIEEDAVMVKKYYASLKG